MDGAWVADWMKVLAEPKANVESFRKRFGGARAELPPNQAVLRFDAGIIESAEFILSMDDIPAAPVTFVKLVLREGTPLSVADLEKVFGPASPVPDEREKPAPTALAEFPKARKHPASADVVRLYTRSAGEPGSAGRVVRVQLQLDR